MIHIQKLFSIAAFLTRVGENVVNLPSRLAAEDYLGATLDAVVLLSVLWARRETFRKCGGYLLRHIKTALREVRLRLTRLSTNRRNKREKDD